MLHARSYVQYESRLEELRRLRREAAGLAGAKKSLSDHALVRRVHFIFERATRKFRGDLALWHAWLQFCKDTRSPRQMSKARRTTSAFNLHERECFARWWVTQPPARSLAAYELRSLSSCPDLSSP